MPRKRTTRAQKERSKPQLKDRDENKDGLSAKERAEKLQTYLKDLDIQVEAELKKFKSQEVVLKRLVKKHFDAILLEFSARQRKMTAKDYCAELEELEKLETLEEAETGEDADKFPDSTPEKITPQERATRSIQIQDPALKSANFGNICQTLSKYRSQPKRTIDPIPEESGAVTTTKKKTRPGRKNGQGVTFNADPPTASRTKNSRFVTPLNQRNLSAVGMNTPLITPKFDPRLPITPAQKRQARPGETFVSLAGSPIQGPKDRTITIPIPEGQEFDELLDEYSVLDDIKITESSKSHMSRIVNALANIIRAQKADEKS